MAKELPWRGNRHATGLPLTAGFTLASVVRGGLEQDAGRGDGHEDPAAEICSGQGDLWWAEGSAEGPAARCTVGGDGDSLQARGPQTPRTLLLNAIKSGTTSDFLRGIRSTTSKPRGYAGRFFAVVHLVYKL